MPALTGLASGRSRREERLTRILGVLGTHVIIARVQYILVHERRTRRDLSEKGHFDRLANLDALPFLHKDLACVLAAVLAVERWHAVLLWVVTLFERLQCRHEVMPACDAVCDNALCDTGCDGTLDNGGNGVHGSDDFGLELWWHVKLDLLEKIFGGAKTSDDEDVLVLLVCIVVLGM